MLDRVKKLEPKILNSHTQLICVTERDIETLRSKLGVKTPATAIATLRDRGTISYQYRHGLGNTILFYGALQSEMNKDAALFAGTVLFPEIRRSCPSATLIIAGSNAGAEIEQLRNHQGISVVPNLSTPALVDLIHNAKVVLLPLRVGAGIKGRVIEAMEAGTPVVGTSIAAEGIPVRNGKEMMIADNPRELVRWTCRILQDDDLRNTISENARLFVEAEYTLEKSYGRVHRCIEMAIATHNASKLIAQQS
jgi:glycosyltransferase involved in cell wall biosynthesis